MTGGVDGGVNGVIDTDVGVNVRVVIGCGWGVATDGHSMGPSPAESVSAETPREFDA
jgi:hypothetical protein